MAAISPRESLSNGDSEALGWTGDGLSITGQLPSAVVELSFMVQCVSGRDTWRSLLRPGKLKRRAASISLHRKGQSGAAARLEFHSQIGPVNGGFRVANHDCFELVLAIPAGLDQELSALKLVCVDQ